MNTKKIRLLLADDHSVLRTGLRMLLDAQPDMEVVGEAGDADEALRQARASLPDVVILDITMPGPGPGRTIAGLLRVHRGTRIVILTMHDDPAYLRAALVAGAAGYVVKKVADTELLSAIRAVHSGRTFIDSTQVTESQSDALKPASSRISRREGQVLRLLAEGHTNQRVAEQLRLSVKTVETYRARLGEKLKLRSRADLYRFAVASGLLAADRQAGSDLDA